MGINIKIPKSEFNVGDRVSVFCYETGLPPSFEAVITGVKWSIQNNHHIYTINDGTGEIDGYTDLWFTPIIT